MNKSLLRDIPKVDDLLRSPTLAHLFADAPRVSVTEALREELDNIRKNILDGALDALPCTEDILSSAAERARLKSRPSLRGVINGKLCLCASSPISSRVTVSVKPTMR